VLDFRPSVSAVTAVAAAQAINPSMVSSTRDAKSLTHPKYRPDIDGLRAVAVLSVVGYHAFRSVVRGGFIGVDIFFVISGFLISSIIFDSLKRDSFSFIEFYRRRIARIFPALLLLLFACYAVGWLTLLPPEYKELGKQIAGGAGYVSNFVLWNEHGYFEQAADAKPLLHLWSLGIEEQYYIFWPLLSYVAWKRRLNLLAITLAIGAVSFALNVGKASTDSVAAFYSPQTRFWELLVGSALAYGVLHRERWASNDNVALAEARSLVGAALIAVGLATIAVDRAFPGWWALLPTIGTALIISAGATAWLNRTVLSNRVLVWFGLISYPLYLWHWPLLSFAQIIENGLPPRPVRLVAVVASIALAWLTYELVEKPLRFGRFKAAKGVGLFACMIVVGALGFQSFASGGLTSRSIAKSTRQLTAAMTDWDYYQTPSLSGQPADITNRFIGLSPQSVLFIGDSLMAQYYPRVAVLYSDRDKLPRYSALFVAKPGCRPIPHGEAVNTRNYGCDAYYVAVMRTAKDPVYREIVIAANWEAMFSDKVGTENLSEFTADIKALKQLGKDIVLISLHPHSSLFDPLQLAKPFRFALFSRDAQRIPQNLWHDRPQLERQDQEVTARLADLARAVGATMVDPFDYFCTAAKCPVVVAGKPLYRDEWHYRASVTRDYATFIDAIVGL
jgi:peptidoglycan/LPS O-acetylase OafA/YrhL